MKRWIAVLVLLAVGAGIVWMSGRAPTAFVLDEECRRYQAERVLEAALLQRTLVGAGHLPASAEYQRRYGAFLGRHKRMEIRGWEILLIPSGVRVDPADFLRAGTFRVEGRGDMRGPITVWIAPRGALARLLHALGAS